MAKGGGSETTQNQSVSQSTTVSVTNVIENPGLSSLEKLNLLADVFQKLDTAAAKKTESSGVNVLVSPQLAANNLPFFIFGGAALMILLLRRK